MAGLLLLCRKFDAARSEEDRRLIFDCYMEHLSVINCWDLVDATCTRIVGKYLLDKERSILYELAGSGDLWTQRIAVVSTLAFVRLRDLPDALAISNMLLSSPYRLIHTAVGWVLREVGKTDKPALTTFIEEHYADMPRVTLRYAIERFSPSEKKYYMGLPYGDN
jgi:3-methyladenine DNA glycosylase AlkD